MAAAAKNSNQGKTASRTVTDTIVGEHTHTIVGYSLIKGIGDGEPIASERFSVGGHEWVLLFYPDGKRSSSSEGHIGGPGPAQDHAPAQQAPMPGQGVPGAPGVLLAVAHGVPAPPVANDAANDPHAAAAPANPAPMQPNQFQFQPHVQVLPQMPALARPQRRDTTNEYAALFVALIGEGANPQGVVNTSEGKVVRAFHRFTLIDQTGQGRDLTKGRTRDAGAVKISCARQDPNARNCHGYRKFVKRSVLEDPNRGFLLNDSIVIKYTIELVVSSGGALTRGPPCASRSEGVRVPPPSLGTDLGALLASGRDADFTFSAEGEDIRVHRIILEARSRVFAALINSPMREGAERHCPVQDIRAPVLRALLHFVYTDSLPPEHDGASLSVEMAQHLLVAADRYELDRLRLMCEKRLCETVEVDSVATTLALAEQNHALELKRVCLEFVSRHLKEVMASDGYSHMTHSCPKLQGDILEAISLAGGAASERGPAAHAHAHRGAGHVRAREHDGADTTDGGRRVRQRRMDP